MPVLKILVLICVQINYQKFLLQSRAKQLYNAGFKTITDVANADPGQVVRLVDHISKKTANQIVAAAKVSVKEFFQS